MWLKTSDPANPENHVNGIYQYTVFRARRITFFLVNRVENQNEPKRPQGGGRLGSFWFSTRPSADTGTDYNLHNAQCMV